ncbi:MAG: T9SS type A sorting domain-containing protein [Cyclobacteriaceae bacterium]
MKLFISLIFITVLYSQALSQNHSIARQWNEATLVAIRNDFARPTVHARNLFHTSIAIYDAWALYDDQATPYLIGNRQGDFISTFDESLFTPNKDEEFIAEVASYAVYRILKHRFRNSPKVNSSYAYFDSLMQHLGHDINLRSVEYADGSAASLGNFIASEVLDYGLLDGANEAIDYNNIYYEPINPPLVLDMPGNPDMVNPDRWQPLAFTTFIDQSGNVIPGNIPAFLSPEWGNVRGFTLSKSDGKLYERDGNNYYVYHDPDPPPFLLGADEDRQNYQWGFSMVAHWSSHLDPSDGVTLDISPASIGNIDQLPDSEAAYPDFYANSADDINVGYAVNPKTNAPYQPQIVPRGDYTRVLAEFWADGPDSETPPGHWFTILNYIMDQPTFKRDFKGETSLNSLEYDAKAYFLLSAAMHDVAITAWAIKGWYDYVRPISAIRYMNMRGQSTDMNAANYDAQGLPLTEGLIELITENDPLGKDPENIGKIKVKSWRGPAFIDDPATDLAGVGWILAEDWWPYQRPTFVTPPFAGYISGHSTFSRAAAEILTQLTGDPFFPGGMGEFVAKKNDFLVFEKGPSTDVILQWATYRDASDQCSLSRIWGGIHPPADDIPGRKIGITIANEAFALAENYFNGIKPLVLKEAEDSSFTLYPNPIQVSDRVMIQSKIQEDVLLLYNTSGQVLRKISLKNGMIKLNTEKLTSGIYYFKSVETSEVKKLIIR